MHALAGSTAVYYGMAWQVPPSETDLMEYIQQYKCVSQPSLMFATSEQVAELLHLLRSRENAAVGPSLLHVSTLQSAHATASCVRNAKCVYAFAFDLTVSAACDAALRSIFLKLCLIKSCVCCESNTHTTASDAHAPSNSPQSRRRCQDHAAGVRAPASAA